MPESSQKLSGRQQGFLACLLRSPTIAAAASAAGISEATSYRWLAAPGFREAYRAARRQTVEQVTQALSSGANSAVEVLLEVAANEAVPAAARVSAAGKVLDLVFKAVELDDLSARIERLEALAAAPALPTNGKAVLYGS